MSKASINNRQGFIPHSRPTLGREEQQNAVQVIETGMICQGEMVERFEKKFAEKCGTAHAVCVNSGTSALHLSLLAMGAKADDEIIIPSYVCTALLNAVSYIGAVPVVVDIDPATLNIDPDHVKKSITSRTKAVIAPHMFGLPADMSALLESGIPVIEDCAQAVGGTIDEKPVGTAGHLAIFSFYATKVMTTGEGGMVVSDSRELIDGVRDLREYDEKGDFKIRYNYKMTDVQAAIGLSQLEKLDGFIAKRRSIADAYYKAFETFNIVLPPRDTGHIFFRYVLSMDGDPERIIRELLAKGIGSARPVYKPLHRYFSSNGCPNADTAWDRSLSLPIYPSLSQEDAERVADVFADVYNHNNK